MTQGLERAARHARATELFLSAVDLPLQERPSFLGRVCGPDAALREAVERLLRADEAAGDFLAPAPRSAGAPRARVGPYQLVRVLGAGGMGTVWLAERDDGQFRKEVALKLVKRGMDSEAVLRRFRQERQVLADLEHPRIARLLDGGTTEEGLPYLVMERVEGRALLEHCEEEGLDVDARLRLFQKVCETVQFAHERGVVHRDLKPGNVLVTRDGEPKLLDFGIAKVLDAGRDFGVLELTRTGERFLSPRYASPEQLRGEPVGPASDVYALGVILYELLTSLHPHGWTTTSWSEFELDVLQRDAPLPSRAVLVRGDVEAPAEGRRARSRRLRGDLDTIVLTALRKEPERRYASARALALDLGRHLAGRPVHARPDTLLYRLAKYVRRNRVLVYGAGAFVLLLSVALAVTLELYADSRRAEHEAQWEAYVGHVAAAENALASARVAEARAHLGLAPEALRGWEWQHLFARLDRARATLDLGHWGAFALDPGRGRVAVSSERGLDVLDAETLAPLLALEPVASPRNSWRGFVDMAFSADGALLASVWDEGDLLVHDTDTGGRLVLRGAPEVGWTSVAFHPHAERLVAGAKDGSLRELDPQSGATLAEQAAHRQKVLALAFDPTGRRLASGSWDEGVILWDAERLVPLHELRGHSMAVYSVAFAPDGSRLASSSLDGTVRIWDVETGAPLIVHHVDGLFDGAVLFAADGERLALALRGGLALLDLRTLKHQALLLGHEDAPTRLALDPTRARLWSRAAGVLKAWDLDTQDVRTFPVSEFSSGIGFDPRGGRFACAGPDGRVRIWSRPEGRTLGELSSGTDKLLGLRFHPREDRLTVLDERGRLVHWDPGAGRELAWSEPTHSGPLGSFSLERDGTGERFLCLLGNRIDLRGADGTALWSFVPPASELLTATALEGRGRWVATATNKERLLLLDERSGELQADLPTAAGLDVIRALAFHPTGDLLAAGHEDGTIVLWDPGARRTNQVLSGCRSRIEALAFHPDGERLASGSLDGTLRLWDVSSGRVVVTLSGHTGRISALEFSPDGAALLSCSDDATLRLWVAEEERAR
jgi:WD40 repeat protein/serine/threonine protein kinase